MKRPIAIAIVAVLLVSVTGFVLLRKPEHGEEGKLAKRAAPESQESVVQRLVGDVKRLRVPVTGDEPARGPRDAAVTIVVFSEFECAACGRALTMLNELEQTYQGKIRTVWRNLPLKAHAQARLAAEAALEAHAQAGSPAFWALHDKLYANPGALSRADLDRYAREVELDLPRFAAALDAHQHEATIKDDVRLGSVVGAREPPSMFINGRPLTGAVTREAVQAIVDDELHRVQKLTTAGQVAVADVYSTLTRGAQKIADTSRIKSLMDQTVYNIPVSSQDPQLGPADALVTLVMFGDIQDHYSRQAMSTIDALRREYGNDLRVVWKNTPVPDFHEDAVPAALLAMETFAQKGNEEFWKALRLMFDNQSALSVADLERYGTQLGLDANKLHQAIFGDAYKPKLGADMELLLRLSPARTTPLFAINGRYLRGAQAPVIFEAFVDEELVKARQKVSLGTPRSKVYEETIKAGRTQHAEVRKAEETLQSQNGS